MRTGALILNLSLVISYIGLWMIQAQRGNLWRADFSAYYTSWIMVKDGRGSQIFDFELEKQYQQDLLGGRSFAEGLLPFNNPPHVALVFTPLGYLSLPKAFGVWTLIQVGFLLWMFWLLNRLAVDWPLYERRMLLITATALPSMLINFLLGTYSLLMLICILQLIDSLRRNHPAQTGIWFVVGMIKPQIMVLPGVLLLASRRWRTLLVSLCGFITLFLVSSITLGWNTWPDFIRQLLNVSKFYGQYGIDPRDMYNFRGMLAVLLGKDHATGINIISVLALIGAIGFIFLMWRTTPIEDSPGFSLRIALTLILGAFFSLHSNPQDGLFLIPSAALFYDYLYRKNKPRRAYATFLMLCPMLFFVVELTIGSQLGVRIPILAMIVLIAWMAGALWKESKYGH